MSVFVSEMSGEVLKNGLIDVSVPSPSNMWGAPPLQGRLYMSDRGYVYGTVSKRVVWFKFLCLAVGLPFIGCAKKCSELAQRCFGKNVPQKGFHDLKHTLKLSGIAFKAVVGWKCKSLFDYVEKFSLAEMDYNNSSRENEMSLPRSQRLTEGVYMAKCMQPLFHRNQLDGFSTLKGKIADLEQAKADLEKSLRHKNKDTSREDWLDRTFNILLGNTDPHPHLNEDLIILKLTRINKAISDAKQMQEMAQRCHKYARMAVMSQNPSHDCKKCCLSENCVPVETDEVECCGKVCYRDQKVCGILHKIDCCATTCFAIDCFCCMCCIWPEGRQACVIT